MNFSRKECVMLVFEIRREQVGGGGLHSHMVWALPEHRSILSSEHSYTASEIQSDIWSCHGSNVY